MQLHEFLTQLSNAPETIQFEDTMTVIDENYSFSPTAFRNGNCENDAGQNNGSCKILAFGRLNDLSVEQTLACFGKFYREDVQAHPDGHDHQNIRQFIKSGWSGVFYAEQPLTPKQ